MSFITENPVSSWAFLNEPFYRWFLMVGGFILILAVKLVNFPNVRSVVGMYLKYINGGIANAGTDITKLRVIANGNNVLSEESALAHAYQMRLWCNSMDLRAGYYPFLFRGRPVETSQYGNMQVGFTPSSVTANTQPTFLGVCTESFYTKGATLPGMLQASG